MSILDRVTVTGADDNTSINDLVQISKRYPWVEWGILASKSNMGGPKFPSINWLMELKKTNEKHRMNISMHLCGKWLRDLCVEGDSSFALELPAVGYKRLQLNFKSLLTQIDQNKLLAALKHLHAFHLLPEIQFIFQYDDTVTSLLETAVDHGINAVPLFDPSGGCGILPEQRPSAKGYHGYAGGLSPGNIHEQLKKIKVITGCSPIWIDAETHLRRSDNSEFELNKVEMFLKAASEYVKYPILINDLIPNDPNEIKTGASFIHIKTQNKYTIVGSAIDATNERDGLAVVVYRNNQGALFVRDKQEFLTKFVLDTSNTVN